MDQYVKVAEEESSKRKVLKSLSERMDRNRERTKDLQTAKIDTAELAVTAEAAFQKAREEKHIYLNKHSKVGVVISSWGLLSPLKQNCACLSLRFFLRARSPTLPGITPSLSLSLGILE